MTIFWPIFSQFSTAHDGPNTSGVKLTPDLNSLCMICYIRHKKINPRFKFSLYDLLYKTYNFGILTMF